MPLAATRIYQMSFFTGFGVSMIIYLALNYVFPPAGKNDHFAEIDESAHEVPASREDANSEEGYYGDEKKRRESVEVHPVA